jgi:hypothetical protein
MSPVVDAVSDQQDSHPTRMVAFILLALAILFGLSDLLPGKFFEDFAAK